MEYEKELRESGKYTELEIQEKMLINRLTSKITEFHKVIRYPLKAEYFEDIWDQCINPVGSKWVGGGHQSGADTIDEISNISYQNKSGVIEKGKTKLECMNVSDLKKLCKDHKIKGYSKLNKLKLSKFSGI